MRRKPIATLVTKDEQKTTWQISWPSTSRRCGKTYYATTYTGQDALLIQTSAKRQVAAEGVVKKLEPTIRLAIAKALEG